MPGFVVSIVRGSTGFLTALLLFWGVGALAGSHALDLYSPMNREPVWRACLERLPFSLELFALALIVTLALSLVLACAYALSARFLRPAIPAGAIVLGSIPFFWLALAAMMDVGREFMLSACLVAMVMVVVVADAWTKRGAPADRPLRWGEVVIDCLRAIASRFPEIVAAQLLVEIVFAWPGLGRLFWNGLTQGDLSAPWAIVLFVSFVTLAVRYTLRAASPERPRQLAVRRAIVVGALGVAALISWLLVRLAVPDPHAIDLAHWTGSALPPCFVDARICGGHVLGTDQLGRDLLARLVAGARPTLGFSFVAAVIASFVVAAVFELMRRVPPFLGQTLVGLADGVSSALPWPLLLVISSAFFGLGWSARNAIPLVVAAAALRSATLIRDGNAAPGIQIVLTSFAFQWAGLMLLLATVDFFGFGLQPPASSWGGMLGGAQLSFLDAWWVAVFPAVCLFLAAMSIRFAGSYISRMPIAPHGP